MVIESATTSSSTESHSTYQLNSIVLRARDSLEVHVRAEGDKPVFVIEDELTSRFYRIGEAEYTFLSMLDGKTTFASALARTASLLHRESLTEDRAANFCKWLVETGLASTDQSTTTERLLEHHEKTLSRNQKGRWSLLTQRFPLIYPRKSVEILNELFGWLFTATSGIAWIALVAFACVQIGTHWTQLMRSGRAVIAADNWMWLLTSWIALKILHEAAHAIACRRFGGNVREAGILFILFVPLPYVDVTSAWRIASRWKRITVSSAGMIAEIAVASMAAIVWCQLDDGLVRQNALNLMVSAGITTLVFNANPLMRFDGYYILVDLMNLPNLYTHGLQALKQWGRKWILGQSTHGGNLPDRHRRFILAYGFAAFAWRLVVCVGLVLAADALFYGLGSLLAAFAILSWAVLPILRLLHSVYLSRTTDRSAKVRFSGVVGVAFLSALALWNWIPWYHTSTAPLVVDYYPRIELRTAVAGFVDAVYVQTGDRVAMGETLVLLRNDELEAQIIDHILAVEQSEKRIAGHLDRHEIATLQIETERLQSLQIRLQELREQQANLQVRAPTEGIVLTPGIQDSLGSYVTPGTRVVELGDAATLQLVASVDQMQADVFRESSLNGVSVHIRGTGANWHPSLVSTISPQASRELIHPALAASFGGPLSVRPIESEDRQEETTHPQLPQSHFELVKPHFVMRAELPSQLHAVVSAGQTGKVCVTGSEGSIGNHLSGLLWNWWNARRHAVEKQLYAR